MGTYVNGSNEPGRTIETGIEVLEDHIHMAAKCYPTLAAGVVLTGAAGAWGMGSIVEVVPVNTITSPFDIHGIKIEAVSAADIYEIVFYRDVNTEIGRVRTTRSNTSPTSSDIPFQTVILPANTKILASVATAGGGADEITVSIRYHVY